MPKTTAPAACRPVSPFAHGDWHAWEVSTGWMLSDESVKKLTVHRTADDVVNHLWFAGAKDAARAFNKHAKEV